MNTTIHNNIKRILDTQNKDFKTLCNELGITQQAFYNRFKGSMSINNLLQIADALGVHITELLKDTPTATPDTTPDTAPSNQITCPVCHSVLTFSVDSNNQQTQNNEE